MGVNAVTRLCDVHFVDGDWTSWNSTTFTLSVIKDCDDIEDDRKNNFKKKKYIYLKP